MKAYSTLIVFIIITFILGILLIAFPAFAWSQDISFIPSYNLVGLAGVHIYLTIDIVIYGIICIAVATLLFIGAVTFRPRTFSEDWRNVSETKWDMSADK